MLGSSLLIHTVRFVEMGRMLFYFLYCSNVSLFVFCHNSSEKFKHKPGIGCTSGDVVWAVPAPSVISCTYLCSRSTVCAGVSYNSNDFTCTGCGEIQQESTNQTDLQGNLFFIGKYTFINLIFQAPCFYHPSI